MILLEDNEGNVAIFDEVTPRGSLIKLYRGGKLVGIGTNYGVDEKGYFCDRILIFKH